MLLRKQTQYLVGTAILASFLVAAVPTELKQRITVQATAKGTSTQMGRQFPAKLIINKLSTAEDRQKLVEAFKRSGHEGMLDALEKMSPKGRVAVEGSVGNDVKYILELPSKAGRRFRLVTDRNIAFAELYQGTRSRDYSIGAAEIVIMPDGKGSGTLLPACKLKLNKKS